MAPADGSPPIILEPSLDLRPVPDAVPAERRRGRGAGLNMASRYDNQRTEAVDDGWTQEEAPPLRTEIAVDQSRSVLARNTSPDVPFDRSVNPYRGCEHGCVYCFARPSHAQLGMSPGLDFETKLVIKPRAPALLAEALRKPGYSVRPIAIGTNTDPYQPIERQHRIMRGVLEVLEAHAHPVWVTTKGASITDDLDILGRMGRRGLAQVTLSLTTLDSRLSRDLEPRAASPGRRLAAVRALADAGVPVKVNLAPVIPGLTDHEIEALLEAAAAAGATAAHYTVLRLPLEVAALFRDWLTRERPERAKRVLSLVRDVHGGRDYDPAWHKRLKGEGVHASLIARRFDLACRRYGLAPDLADLRTDLFAPPPRPGDQLSLGF
ncbi:MAG: PA0069 family radical SAM protein [Pseudomonadota bacterium]